MVGEEDAIHVPNLQEETHKQISIYSSDSFNHLNPRYCKKAKVFPLSKVIMRIQASTVAKFLTIVTSLETGLLLTHLPLIPVGSLVDGHSRVHGC